MDILMFKGSGGPDVDLLRTALAGALGDDAAGFASLGRPGAPIDDDLDAAIRRWQAGSGIISDGVVGPRCQVLLGLVPPQAERMALTLSVGQVSQVFPATKPANIARYLQYIEAALGVAQLTDPAMILGALGTIRAETEGFVPISEFQSRFNTPPGGAPFSLYDHKKSIGNDGAGEGMRFRGRGFVQLTGRANYTRYGQKIGLHLENLPDLANAPEIAAVLLALFLQDKKTAFRAAVQNGDLAAARKLVNGGSHGLAPFEDVFRRGAVVWKDEIAAALAAAAAPAGLAGRAGRPAAKKVAQPPAPPVRVSKTSKTRKDAADLRDRLYMPPALTLPDAFPPLAQFHDLLPAYTRAKLILNQGSEGACTGFGLACVINYMRWVKAGTPPAFESVSPRMLYTFARRYDEYEGENYEGSSCRGAIKGWFNHGVCLEPDWPYAEGSASTAKYGFANRAARNTLGVYYRIEIQSITDMQAAIAQHGAVFVSAYTHKGWDRVRKSRLPADHAGVPVIEFDGRRSETDGHAFAFVGYTDKGFILQNSWGPDFGAGGFGILGYLDWLANAMDAWVVSLGVPQVISGQLAAAAANGASHAVASAGRSKGWDTTLAYQHSVVLGNDGRVSRYLTEDEGPRKLQQQVYALPDQWFRTQPAASAKRLVLYVHGGLNSEAQAIKRAAAMGPYFAGNGCYALFLVWKTGLLESIGNIVSQNLNLPAAAAGGGFREAFTEKTDLMIEKLFARPAARPIWSEMKENADLAFAARRGGDLLLDALQALVGSWGAQFELHLVGHSAGAIAIGHLLTAMAERKTAQRDDGLGERLRSISLFAPACSVAFANRHYARDPELMKRLHLDVLSDKQERDDNVAYAYRKSLLYLVANALETDVHLPILGLDLINDPSYAGWDGTSDTGDALKAWRTSAADSELDARTTRVKKDEIRVAISGRTPVLQAAAHGGFDNDIDVMTSTLLRITGAQALAMPIDDLRGF